MGLHHISIRTADIHRAIAFYECLGFRMETRFTTGYTLACWLVGWDSRIELLAIPEPKPAVDGFHDQHYVGYYHLSFDLTVHLGDRLTLADWLDTFKTQLGEQGLPWQLLLKPTQQVIGDRLYQVAFVADSDGLPLEFLWELGHVS